MQGDAGHYMELSREAVYSNWRQRLAWVQHYLKARYNPKERPRVLQLSRFIPEGGVIFDVGAHFGYLAKEFCAIHGGSCKVHCFEPVSYTRSILQRVVGRFGNVRIDARALSNQAGNVRISIPVKESGRLGIGLSHFGDEMRRDYIVEQVETLTLDAYMDEQAVPRLDFIKCDVEGAELLVLQGAEHALARHRPVVYCELNTHLAARMGYQPERVFDFLSERGYTAFILDAAGEKQAVTGVVAGADDYLFLPPAAAA